MYLKKRNKSFYEICGSRQCMGLARKQFIEHINCVLNVAEGLKFLHEINLIHRDLKPANILLTHPNHWKIADFDLMRDGDSTMTSRVGTESYRAPEQLGDHYDHRVDLYAFGLVMYELAYLFKMMKIATSTSVL